MKKLLLFTASIFAIMSVMGQASNDTSQIKALLEKESATWRSGDLKAHADCWHIQPYSKILVSLADGKCYDVPAETIMHPAQGMMGNGGISVNTNYLFSIHGDNAWVSHDEKSTGKDGTVTYSHEIRMLEKINNVWKLVAQSIHIYQP
ncbi:MAG TPA: hypothetical protein VGC95_09670 [Chitinophagaceae bacterium]|jgi:hypothetical protein